MPIRVGLKHVEIWNTSLENEVLKYEQEPVVTGQIVFYGPSNFTRWSQKWKHTPLREALPGQSGKPCAINRGFGSSCAEHHLYYYPRMVRPLAPKVLVYSPFGNHDAFGYSIEETWELAQRVIAYAFADFPDIKIYLCGMHKRNEATPQVQANRQACNVVLQQFAAATPNCYYLNTYDHEPLHQKDIFADHTHFNQKGYDLYAAFFKEALKEELAQF